MPGGGGTLLEGSVGPRRARTGFQSGRTVYEDLGRAGEGSTSRAAGETEGSPRERVEAENQGQAVKDLANPRRCELAHTLG